MSRLTQRPTLNLEVSIKLTESEVRALDALSGYGADAFLKVFYAQMGRHYMEPHESGLRSLFDTIRTELPPIMKRMRAAKQAFSLADPVVRSRSDHDALISRITSEHSQAAHSIKGVV
ncbi:hypothetical protein [Limnohabitans sp.]|uniref:hypothetical protein n=1 Tax=Limnohabitans sp. TaxID=1907725 RepID=UPI00286F1065|nr:hypothetical protein [Limnohabitans sp.]